MICTIQWDISDEYRMNISLSISTLRDAPRGYSTIHSYATILSLYTEEEAMTSLVNILDWL